MIEITPEFLLSQGFSLTLPSRFFAKVDKTSSPHGCWLWTAYRGKYGYGKIGPNGKPKEAMWAPRVSWILHHGPIPKGLHVLHNCPGGDNPACVNPDHLWLGTHLENVADMNLKKRHGSNTFKIRGEKNPLAKLSTKDIVEIRKLCAEGKLQREVAALFSITRCYVGEIVRCETRLNG